MGHADVLAAGFQVSGVHGFILVLACLAFFAAAIIGWFAAPRMFWATAIAAGLFLLTLSYLVT